MGIIWLVAGGIVGGLHVLLYVWTVNHLHPAGLNQGLLWLMGGATLRWLLTVSLLIIALQQGLAAALLSLIGVGLVYSVLLTWIAWGDNNLVAGD